MDSQLAKCREESRRAEKKKPHLHQHLLSGKFRLAVKNSMC